MDGFNVLDYEGIILFHYARNQSEHYCWEAIETFKDGMHGLLPQTSLQNAAVGARARARLQQLPP